MLIYIFSFFIILLLLVGLNNSLKRSFFFSMALSITAIIIFSIEKKINAASLFLLITSYNIVPPVSQEFKKLFKYKRDLMALRLEESKKECQTIISRERELEEFTERLNIKLDEIAYLYEITKELSVSMRHNEMMQILVSLLRERISFTAIQFILMDEEKERPLKVYLIKKTESSLAEEFEPPADYNKALLEAISRKDDGLFLASVRDGYSYGKARVSPAPAREGGAGPANSGVHPAPSDCEEKLGAKRGWVHTLAGINLKTRDKIIAFLVIENPSPEEQKSLSVLAGQIGLQVNRIKLYEKIQELAITDGLTGIYVRRHLLERFQEELERSGKHKLKLSFLMIDIDHFKECNDEYGHLVGDAVLKEIAQMSKQGLRQVDLVGRYGGEELGIVLPETAKEGARQAGEKLRKEIERYNFKAYDEVTKITVSVGVATFPDDASNREELIEKADRALYKAKATGRNKVCVY